MFQTMDETFIYSKYVTGKNFIGRHNEARVLANLLVQGENAAIYEAPKSGKMSLLRQAFFNLQSSGVNFRACMVSLLDIRSLRDLTLRLASEVLRCFCSSPDEFSSAAAALLDGSRLYFDEDSFSSGGSAVSAGGELDDNDMLTVLRLPYRAAARMAGSRIFVVFTEFQNVMLTEDGDRFCALLQQVFCSRGVDDRNWAAYVFSGSAVNAMHEIFGQRKLFFRQVERVKLEEIETREIIEHINRSLLTSGKVIDRDLLLGTCKLFRNNIWYINHFAAICDSLSKGYIMENTLTAALESLISIHEPRFIATMNDLTTFQVNMLKAILCGHTRFTSAEVIEEFGLSSSANVRRLKDALAKKEIVNFEAPGTPELIDPLFEYWVRTRYFGMKI